MKIFDMVNGQIPNANPSQSVSNKSNAGFDMLLAEAGRRQTFEPAVDHQSRSREDNRERTRTNETRESRREEQPVRRRDNQPRTEDTATTAESNAVQYTAEATNTYDTSAVYEEKVIAKIAEILQVPAEVVVEWLEELGMTASDLTDSQAVTKLLQKALGAESAIELLTDSAFPEIYKAINEALAGLAIEAKPVFNMQKAETTVKDKNVVSVLAEGLEGLEAKIEDGELVITKDTANNETTANNQSQSNATQAETITAEQKEVAEVAPELKEANLLVAEEATASDTQPINPMVNMDVATVRTEQAVRQVATQQPIDTKNVIEQIMNQVKLTSNGGQFNEIRMTLRPETLGDIVLRVLTQNGIVTAQFEAENQRVKEALESSFNQLRDALEEQGIQFSELSVSVRQDENEQRMNEFERARQNSRYRAESIEDVSEEEVIISQHNGFIDVTA